MSSPGNEESILTHPKATDEYIWLKAQDDSACPVRKTKFRNSVSTTSPYVTGLGEETWNAQFAKKGPLELRTREKLNVVVEMLAYRIDYGYDLPLDDWTAPIGTENVESMYEPSPVTKYLHLYSHFNNFGMTNAKNETMRKMCQLVCQVNDPAFPHWTITQHDLKFVFEDKLAIKANSTLLFFVLEAVLVNEWVTKASKKLISSSLPDFAWDALFLRKYSIHMTNVLSRSRDTGQPVSTKLEQLAGVGKRGEAECKKGEVNWTKLNYGALLEDEAEDAGGEERDPAEGGVSAA